MNFISNNSLTDIRYNYKKVAEEFCKEYYTRYDNNFLSLGEFFKSNSLITFMDEELTGFQNLCDRLRISNINSFRHIKFHVNAQPVGDDSVLLVVKGTISVNGNLSINNFTETVLIRRDSFNRFFVENAIFKLTE